MHGIILAGGEGTRLSPLTLVANKHLLPVYNQPMIDYPIGTLKKLGINDILIITGGDKVGKFADYLGDGSKLGVGITYRVQEEAGGIAHALALAEDYTCGEKMAVILGDNIFENKYIDLPQDIAENEAVIFVKKVPDPERFGVVGYNSKGEVISIVEKPVNPASNDAVVGLYIYPPCVFDVIRTLNPSERGELEISDVNNFYLREKSLTVRKVSGFWSDAGTFDSLLNSSNWAQKNYLLDK